jgi:hypothetical protein
MKVFDNDRFKFIVHENDRLTEFIAKKNVIIEVEDILKSRDILHDLKFDGKCVSLYESTEGSQVSGDARRFTASGEYFKYVGALAIYTAGIYESIRGNLFTKIHRPKVPTRFFDNRSKAISWLKQQSVKS